MELHEDKFWEDYKPQINHIEREKISNDIADEDITSWNGCMYETYGEDLEYVFDIEKKEKRVWTILNCDDDENGNSVVVISAGFHRVNREGYLITENPWETGAEYVEIVFELDN
jgi:hypothetical protein